MLSAYLLISHGSSDPRHKAGLLRLANLMRQRLDRSLCDDLHAATIAQQSFGSLNTSHPYRTPSSQARVSEPLPFRPVKGSHRITLPPTPIVGIATLEATSIPLSQQIETFAKRVMAQGIRQVVIMPLFLLAGVHVGEDLPREIAVAESHLPAAMQLLCTPYLGSHPSFKRFMAARLGATTADRCLLLAHGSRRAAGNRSVQQLGAILDADVAFWSVPPDLETQVIELIQQGHQQIAIAPYFLFPGGITDAITRRAEDLAERLPKISLRLLTPLGNSADLAKAVAELALSIPHSATMPTWGQDRWQLARDGITA